MFGWVSLNFTGGCLAIEHALPDPDRAGAATPAGSVRQCGRGEILAVEIESGFAAVTVGQTVARGQMLAAAERLDRKGNAVPQSRRARYSAGTKPLPGQAVGRDFRLHGPRPALTTLYLPWRSSTSEPENPLTGITQTGLAAEHAAGARERRPPAFAA